MATDPHIDGVVAVIPQGDRLLVIRRSRHVVAPGKFCFRDEPVPNPAEVESFHWLDRTELEQLPDLLESNHEFLRAWDRGEFSLP